VATTYTYISANSGAAWTPVEFVFLSNPEIAVASSADGSKLVAALNPGLIYTWQPPALTIAAAGTNMAISWPSFSSTAGFALQVNSDLTTTNWTNVAAAPASTNGQYVVTVPVVSTQQFFRLESP
jgi:hypothetical protein